MAENTKIEWATATFNPWIGCQKVSPGCDNCYAEHLMDKRLGRVEWGPHGERKRTSEAYWRQPIHWARTARYALEVWQKNAFKDSLPKPSRPRVFCASLADVFDNQVPKEWRRDLFNLIRATPELDWLLLTKRPENIAKMFPFGANGIMPNVWLGFTAEDQEHFNRRWPIVREIPAAVRFCSYEPAVGPLRFVGGGVPGLQGLDWVICGGESGAGYREMPLEWETGIRTDCKVLRINYFFKQLSGKKPVPPGFKIVRQFPEARR